MADNLSVQATHQPDTKIEYNSRKRLNEKDWKSLALDLMNGVNAAYAGRETLTENLKDSHDAYEMLSQKSDPNWPVENASDIVTPLIASQVDALVAYIAGQVLVPSLFIVTGNTDKAAAYAPLIERYYNAEFKRQRGDTTWFEQLVEWLLFSMRDGTGYVEGLWRYKKTTARVNQYVPQMVDEGGVQAPVLGEDGKPVYDKIETTVDDILNAVNLQAKGLKDILLLPATAKSIESAMAVICPLLMFESDLMELVHSAENPEGVLDKDEVEAALSMAPAGKTELPTSPVSLADYEAGEQLEPGIGQGTQTSKFFKNRGPLLVYRVHSKQYDLDMDGVPEENVFWVHRSTQRMLGWMRYQYFNGLRPVFKFCPFPRPGEHLGFGVPERLMGLQNEKDAQRNQRIDEGNLRLGTPFIGRDGSKLQESWTGAWGSNYALWTEDPQKDFQRIVMEPLPQSAFAEEQIIERDASGFTGLDNPGMGTQSSSRRSAQEARQESAARMTRTGLLAMRFRIAIRPVVNFIHALNKQFLTTDVQFQDGTETLTIPRDAWNHDYNIDLAGSSDPIDAASRRTEALGGAEVLMKFPVLAQSPLHQYYLLRKIVNAMGWGAEADQLIGTEKDALQMQQQQQMQQQAMQAQQQQGQQQGQAPPGGPPQQ